MRILFLVTSQQNWVTVSASFESSGAVSQGDESATLASGDVGLHFRERPEPAIPSLLTVFSIRPIE